MSDELRLRIDVQNKRVVKEIEGAINRGIKDAVGAHAPDGIPGDIIDAAQERIIEKERVWRGELVESFDVERTKTDDGYIIVIENDLDYAKTTDEGRTPGEDKPPLSALIPWVEAHLDDWDVDPEYYE